MTPSVTLSVVVVSFNGPERLRACLASVAPQIGDANAEILVVGNWDERGGPRAALGSEFTSVRWIEARLWETVPVMRRLGMSASRARVVALLEDDCTVAADWCRAVVSAHATADVAIGGAVEPGAYRRGLDWAVYFCEYGRYMLPLPERATADLPGNNVSYKRDALEELPTSPPGFYDVVVHRQWQAEGRPMRADATLVVRQANSWSRRHVTSVPFQHGRGFAGQRVAGWSRTARAGMSVLALFLPILTVARIMKIVINRRRHVAELARALPWIVVFAASWSLGESIGYLVGPGDSLSRWR